MCPSERAGAPAPPCSSSPSRWSPLRPARRLPINRRSHGLPPGRAGGTSRFCYKHTSCYDESLKRRVAPAEDISRDNRPRLESRAGHSVDTATGAFVLDVNVASLQGGRIPLEFNLEHNSMLDSGSEAHRAPVAWAGDGITPWRAS